MAINRLSLSVTLPPLTRDGGPDALSQDTVIRNVFHEVGSAVEKATIVEKVEIDPQSPPQQVVFYSHVLPTGSRLRHSPEYLAAIRRRAASRLETKIRELAHHVEEPGFVVFAHEILGGVRTILETLTDAESDAKAEHEGNACEIFRLLRDCLVNDGWKRLHEPPVRECFGAILRRLSAAEEVGADDVADATDQLLDRELNPSVGFAW